MYSPTAIEKARASTCSHLGVGAAARSDAHAVLIAGVAGLRRPEAASPRLDRCIVPVIPYLYLFAVGPR